MTLELDLKPQPSNVLKRAVSLLDADSRIVRDASVSLDSNRKVHLWGLGNKSVMVILEQDRRFIGVKKRKGSFDAILKYYQDRSPETSDTTNH